jgi:hypothetical protein
MVVGGGLIIAVGCGEGDVGIVVGVLFIVAGAVWGYKGDVDTLLMAPGVVWGCTGDAGSVAVVLWGVLGAVEERTGDIGCVVGALLILLGVV